MKKILFAIVLSLTALKVSAYDFLRAVKDSIPGGYNFWVYTPVDYFYSQEQTPVIIFLHGASLCGRDLSRVRRYGPLDAIVKGRDIDALTIVPQNPGGAWSPKKVMDVFDWVRKHYACDSTRGGTSLKDVSGLGKLPFWIIHGTADRAVPVKQSKVVVEKLKKSGNDSRLLYDWLPGANHGAPARIFYLKKTYEWLFSHSLVDKDRPVNKSIDIGLGDLRQAYRDVNRNKPAPELIDGPSIIKEEGNEY